MFDKKNTSLALELITFSHTLFVLPLIFTGYFISIEKFNLIIFLSKNWGKNWGGELCFYLKNPKNKKMPGRLYKKIQPKFNRAVFFDTSISSWHSVEPIREKKTRKTVLFLGFLVEDRPPTFHIF